MPAKSKSQMRFFKMLEHNPEVAKEKGMSSETAKEYTKENKGKKAYSQLMERITPKKK